MVIASKGLVRLFKRSPWGEYSIRPVTGSSDATIISGTYGGVTISAILAATLAPVDAVFVTRADYTTSKRELRVEVASSEAGATLRVYVTSTNALIGTLPNNGGRYGGQFNWPSNP